MDICRRRRRPLTLHPRYSKVRHVSAGQCAQWWNPEVDKLWEAKREALKRSQRNRNPDDLEPKRAEKEAVKTFKLAASEAKDAVYEEFCQEVSKDRALF